MEVLFLFSLFGLSLVRCRAPSSILGAINFLMCGFLRARQVVRVLVEKKFTKFPCV